MENEGSVGDLVGRVLGQYTIIELLGRGGMATVYKGYQAALDRQVAVKVLDPYLARDPGFAERFRREALSIAGLEHPNILPVYDFGEEGGVSYIVMQLVPGGTLQDRMRDVLPLGWSVDICGQVARALDHAHARNIVHRDVKPANVLLRDGDWALLGDFGIAKMLGSGAKLTGTGLGVGTPAYLSPEQAQGLAVDSRSDVYSLGMTLFEMLGGTVAYAGDTPLAVILKQINDPVPSIRAVRPEIPQGVDDVLQRALAKRSEDRFPTAGAFADALRRAAAPSGRAASASSLPPTVEARYPSDALEARRSQRPLWPPLTRRSTAWLTGVGVCVALIAVLALALVQRGPIGASSDPGTVVETGVRPAASDPPDAASAPVSGGSDATVEARSDAPIGANPLGDGGGDTERTQSNQTPIDSVATRIAEVRQGIAPRAGRPSVHLALEITHTTCSIVAGTVTAQGEPVRGYALKGTYVSPNGVTRSLGGEINVVGPQFRLDVPLRRGTAEVQIVASKAGFLDSAPAHATLTC
ncbi:MAG TPA: protein kinase [Chloroflexota bacterium]|nr:protein kinase [Chloroflexota bacterium]